MMKTNSMTWAAMAAVGVLVNASGAEAQITNFSRDVSTAIDRGLRWMDMNAVFQNPSTAGEGAGLSALALLEKRESADPNSPPTGYSNALPADKARVDAIMAFIIERAGNPATTFSAYRDGADLMALSVYLRTGGVLAQETANAVALTFDRIAANQGAEGYWCYTNGSCPDSSTTQLVMAGLASVKGVFSDPVSGDAARLAALNTLAANVRTAYTTFGKPGDLEPELEKCHGYNGGSIHASYPCSYQQTASGMWGQIIGGADLNDASVQGYLRWLRNYYNYETTAAAAGGWSNSYQYFLWSSAKGFKFLQDAGIAPVAGNVSVDDLGMLDPAGAPAAAFRLRHRDPAVDARVPAFGVEPAGYYDAPNLLRGWYYDYAYTLINLQDPAGFFQAGPGNSQWDGRAEQAYSILVLERSLGGGCNDTDNDGVCDAEDRCPSVSNRDQLDGDGDGVGDVCDNCAAAPNREQLDADADGVGDACETCPDNPRTEVCNGIDDDCNDLIDEDLGEFSCATGLGGLCSRGIGGCVEGSIACEPIRQPMDELCNGVDDNCDGHIDENVRNACGTCEPTVPAETCDGLDNDCDGIADDEAACPEGERCGHGVCEDPCAGVDCAEGFQCEEGFCVDLCVFAQCPRGWNCELGNCSDPCADVTCESPLICFGGQCVPDDCLSTGCEAEQRCREIGCEADPCTGVSCGSGEFCRDGACVISCAGIACGLDQRCSDGNCVPDLCYGVMCPENTFCRLGECESDLCLAVTCTTGRICIDGTCLIDPCNDITCPLGQVCTVQRDGTAQCADTVTPVEPPLPDAGMSEVDAAPPITDAGGSVGDIGGGSGDATRDDAALEGEADASNDSMSTSGAGCACELGGSRTGTSAALLLLVVPGLIVRRRRARR
jgi:hypothetical protein